MVFGFVVVVVLGGWRFFFGKDPERLVSNSTPPLSSYVIPGKLQNSLAVQFPLPWEYTRFMVMIKTIKSGL